MRLHAVRSLARYAWRAQTIYDVHAPLAYGFLGEVVEDDRDFYAFDAVEAQRRRLLSDRNLIRVRDHGAGSQVNGAAEREVRDIARASATPPRFGRYLHRLVDFTGAERVLELGTNLGIGSAYLATALPPRGKLITVDADPGLLAKARETLDALPGGGNVTVVEGTFAERLPAVTEQLGGVDLAFVDGHHAEDPTVAYFEAIAAKCTPGSVVVVDDIHWSPGMERAWERIRADDRVTLTIDLQRWGVVFFDRGVRVEQHLTVVPRKYKPWHVGFFSSRVTAGRQGG